jgi:hypothetical protein
MKHLPLIIIAVIAVLALIRIHTALAPELSPLERAAKNLIEREAP